ncbi:MAG: Bifunctional purine biosynthetic protein ade1 [Caeruleum heppii]|nr:MAG: Bifunctional purine biosynthetic protein ade1 [Caeruleum heppii]
MSNASIMQTDLGDALPLIARGKVRDLYAVDDRKLLFVATDRISAYDVVLKNGIPRKGALLTLLSAHWFSVLSEAVPHLKTHFLSLELPSQISAEKRTLLRYRSMQVRKVKIFPIEAIVRGYITGSAWKEYQAKGTVHGIKLRHGLRESEELPDGALYTPSTKAEAGEHDENIHPDQARQLLGDDYAQRIEDLAVKLYTTVLRPEVLAVRDLLTTLQARDYAKQRGIIIADTKFEFGLDPRTDEIILVDEVLTPDSSRFWPASTYQIGVTPTSFDKQYLRDWLTATGKRGVQGVTMPDDVVAETSRKYEEAFEMVVGKRLDSVMSPTQ